MPGRRLAAATALILTIGPAAIAAQEKDRNRPMVQFAAGSHLRYGGDSQSLSFGIPAGRYLSFLVSAERSHLPTQTTRYEYGFSTTRGTTLKFVSLEIRLSRAFERVTPYGFFAAGRGTSRLNASETSPNRVTNSVALPLMGGGGVRFPLNRHLSAFVDARFAIWVGIKNEELGLMMPVRGGLAWKF